MTERPKFDPEAIKRAEKFVDDKDKSKILPPISTTGQWVDSRHLIRLPPVKKP